MPLQPNGAGLTEGAVAYLECTHFSARPTHRRVWSCGFGFGADIPCASKASREF